MYMYYILHSATVVCVGSFECMQALLAIGGQTTLGFARYFCNQEQNWVILARFPQLPFERVSNHSLITVAGKLFLVGESRISN